MLSIKKALVVILLLGAVSMAAAQPPNNTTCNANTLPVVSANEFGEACTPSIIYSWTGATYKGLAAEGLICQQYGEPKTVWYKFTVPASGDFTISLAPSDGNYNPDFLGGYQFALFSADKCATVTAPSYHCTSYTGPNGYVNFPTVVIRNQTPGSLHYLALWREGGVANGSVKLCISDVPKIAPDNQRVGIGINTPRKNLDVNGNMHVQGNLSLLGKIGIGTSNPQYALDVNGRLRIKGNPSAGNESAGIWFNKMDNTAASVFLGLASDSIFGIYGNFGSDWQGFTMNKNSGLVSMNKGYKSAFHLGRLVISKDPATGVGETAGVMLGNNANNGFAAFMGLYNDNIVGLYGPGSGWSLTMNTNTGNVGIRLNGANPARPLSFPAELGEKILLYPGANGEVGIGVYGNELRLHADNPGAKVSFGTQNNNGVFTEVGKFEKNGNYALSVFGSIWANGTTYASDSRFKKNIEPLDSSLYKVLQLQGVSYQMNTDAFPRENFDNSIQVGLVAQEVEKIVPEVVATGPDGYKAIDYAKLVPLLIESIKAQEEKIRALNQKIERMEKKRKFR